MRKPIVALALALLSLLTLAGCWDRREVDEIAFVLAIGLDKGQGSVYRVTTAVAIPSKMAGGVGGGGGGGGKGEDEKPFLTTTVEAPTVTAALSMIDSYLSRDTSLQHAKFLFMGEALARESGMYAMDELSRFRDSRSSMNYVVTKGEAGAFLEQMKGEIDEDPHKFLGELMRHYTTTGMTPRGSQIHHYISHVSTGYAEPLTYYAAIREDVNSDENLEGQRTHMAEARFEAGEVPRKGGPNIELVGGAAFRGEKLAGILTGQDMRMILLLQGEPTHPIYSFQDPERPDLFFAVELGTGRTPEWHVDLSGPPPRIRGQVTLEGELYGLQSDVNYSAPANLPRLEATITKQLRESIQETIKKTQGWGADVVGFGKVVVREFSTVQSWEDYAWLSRYGEADIDVDVRVTLRRFGSQLGPPRPQEEQGGQGS